MIDHTQPVYDTCGNQHQVFLISDHQIGTLYANEAFIWNRQSGQCMLAGLGDVFLTNDEFLGIELSIRGRSPKAVHSETMCRDILRRIASKAPN